MPVLAIVGESYRLVMAERQLLVRSAGLWWAVSVLTAMLAVWSAGSPPAEEGPPAISSLVAALAAALSFLAGAAVAVAWHRRVLIAEELVAPAAPIGARAVVYLLWSLVVGAIAIVLPSVLATPVIIVGSALGGLRNALTVLAGLGALYLVARLSVILPAKAVGRAASLRAAWALTSGQGWRALAITILVVAPVELATTLASILLGTAPGLGFGLVLGIQQAGLFAATALGAVALSLVYRELSQGAPTSG